MDDFEKSHKEGEGESWRDTLVLIAISLIAGVMIGVVITLALTQE
ncbi:hypothetical protein [Xanthomonas albilineans]|nr:hypothetical protein [Xanthomonas albilineans]